MGRKKGSKNKIQLSFEEKFWMKVSPFRDKNKCWEWEGNLNNSGYGHFFHKGKMFTAHRASYSINVEQIPEGLQVLHSCDNRKCVNPNHLWLGTNYDNVQDRESKGRGFVPDNRGEKSGNSKLTVDNVKRIRELYLSEKKNRKELSKLFNISLSSIYDILDGRTWTWLS